jgi:phage/plasmid-associated DNA primase
MNYIHDSNYYTLIRKNPIVKRLLEFLSNDRIITPPQNKYTNIINPRMGKKGTFCIPFSLVHNNIEYDSGASINSKGYIEYDDDNIYSSSKSSTTPMDKFFNLVEDCRRNNIILNFQERASFTVPQQIKKLKPVPSDFNDDDDDEEYYDPDDSDNSQDDDSKDDKNYIELDDIFSDDISNTNQKQVVDEDIDVIKSGIELDFDVYQKDDKQHIQQSNLYQLIYGITEILGDTLDFAACHDTELINMASGTIIVHAVIIKKPKIVPITHKTYGNCYKDSFHIRFPGIKVSKSYKMYLVNEINNETFLSDAFRNVPLCGPVNEVLDKASSTLHPMVLGCCKIKGPQVAHKFHSLYEVRIGIRQRNRGGTYCILEQIYEFDPIIQPVQSRKDPRDRRRTLKNWRPPPEYKYNLCYELSLHFENPDGLIKKREFECKKDFLTDIKLYQEKHSQSIIKTADIREIQDRVSNLTLVDFNAHYLQQILGILSDHRVKDFQTWKSIIIILARENPDYRPLAIWFSQRAPKSFTKGGMKMIEQLWTWALDHPTDTIVDEEGNEKKCNKTVKTIYYWAKEDNPEEYKRIQETNVFNKLNKMVMETQGKLNDTNYAILLHMMFGRKFVLGVDPKALTKANKWYEFVLPSDNSNARTNGSAYKWCHKQYPFTLARYITDKLPKYVDVMVEWVKSRNNDKQHDDDPDTDASQQKFFTKTLSNLLNSKNNLGNMKTVNPTIAACVIRFVDEDFFKKLDTDGKVIGVGNGVLQLKPHIDLIQKYHEIKISRFTDVPYKPFDPKNAFCKTIEDGIKMLFAGEQDAYEFVMMYLASTLDGEEKSPFIFIWLGEGSNGKSFLTEMHTRTLRPVDDDGYAAKIPSSFFTADQPPSSRPNSALMMLKYARFSCAQESEDGDVLKMANIKEMTSDTMSGRDLNKRQEMFKLKCRHVIASNYDPRITGRDHGTWRRILIYRFKLKFTDKPDPNNPLEQKNDSRFIEVFPNQIEYKTAYLGLLVKFYKIYHEKYNGNLNLVPKPTIDKETLDYRNEQDTVHKFITYRTIKTDVDENGDPIEDIKINIVAKKYIKWYENNCGDNHRPNLKTVMNDLKKSGLKKYIVYKHTGTYLTKHIVLGFGEEYDGKKITTKSDKKEKIDIDQEEFDDLDKSDDDIPTITSELESKSKKEEDKDEDKDEEVKEESPRFDNIELEDLEDDLEEYLDEEF